MRPFLLKSVLLAVALLPAAAGAQVPTSAGHPCGDALAYPGMSAATACWGAYIGNDQHYLSFIQTTVNAAYPNTWTYLGKTNTGGTTGPFSSVPGGATGTLVFSGPLTGPFVLSLKAGPNFAFYYFPNPGTINDLVYNTYGVNPANPGGNFNGLSHASLWAAGTYTVPEPATLLLIGTGLLGVGFAGHRRRRRG